jgi:hypothetical protein
VFQEIGFSIIDTSLPSLKPVRWPRAKDRPRLDLLAGISNRPPWLRSGTLW